MLKKVIYLFLIIAIISCKEPESPFNEFPQIFTNQVDMISENGATFSGSIKRLGQDQITEHGFVWSTEQNPILTNSQFSRLGPINEIGDFTFTVATTLVSGLSNIPYNPSKAPMSILMFGSFSETK